MTGLQGATFGGYQLLAPLGAGGVAEAYRAKSAQGAGREVVVKVIQPTFAQQPGFQERFRQALQKAARLANHAHVLPVLASGEENGYAYLVTPFVTDGTLQDWLARGWRLGPSDVGPFFRQLATGLDYAHSLGITHENLKPHNIFLFEGRHVLLADFGLLWDIAEVDPQLASPAAGAVEYFAPEAFSKVVSPATDIYSLGAVLFATLAGHAPFRGPTPGAVYAAHANQPPPSLSGARQGLDHRLQALDPVIQRAMAKRPEDRFPTALLFADAVDSTIQSAQPGGGPKSLRPSVWSLGSDNPITFNEYGAPVLANSAQSAPLGPQYATGGASQLQGLNFSPPSTGLEGLMEDGRIAASWNDAGEMQTARAPAPMGPLYAPPMAPPTTPRQDFAPGMTPGMPPGMTPGMPTGYPPGPPQYGGQGYPGGYAPGIPQAYPPPYPLDAGLGYGPPTPNGAMAHAPAAVTPGGVPAFAPPEFPPADPGGGYKSLAPTPLAPEAPAADRGYSATELGLPRLTFADLGKGLSLDAAEQMDAKLRPEQSGRSGEIGYDESSVYTATHGGARIEYRGETSESAAWSAAGPAAPSEWGYSEEQSAYYPNPAPARGGRGRSNDRWDAGESIEAPARPRRGPRTRDRDGYDEYADGRGYSPRSPRRSQKAATQKRSRWARPVVFGVVPLLILGLALLAIARPSLCPNGMCNSLSARARQAVPALNQLGGASGATVSLAASPTTLHVTTQAGVAQGATFSLVGVGASNVPWQATSNLAWITISPPSGTLTAGSAIPITVTAKPEGVNPGQYSAVANVTAGGASLQVPVAITVTVGPQLTVTPTSLSFTTCASQQAITVKNSGDASLSVTAAPTTNSTAALTLSATSLALDPNASDTIKVSVKCSAAVSPSYGVQFTSNGGSAQVTVKYS